MKTSPHFQNKNSNSSGFECEFYKQSSVSNHLFLLYFAYKATLITQVRYFDDLDISIISIQ